MIKAIYDLDMTPRRSLPIIINVSQNDDLGRTLVFNLFSSTGTWTAPDSATATLEGGKPDGKFFSYNCTYSKGTVTAIIQQQMTAVSGKVVCKVKVQSGSKVIESAPIYMMVDAAGIPDGADMSKSDINDAVASATQKIVEQVAGSIPEDYSKLNQSVEELKSDFIKQPKVIYIRGLGQQSDNTSGVTGVNQYYAHKLEKKLKFVTKYTSSTSFTDITVEFDQSYIYLYNGELYKYSGSGDFDGLEKIESEKTETDTIERKQIFDGYVYQMMNILDSISENSFYGKTLTIAEADGYISWPMISYVDNQFICCYARGIAHEDSKSGTYYKISPNGIIWSSERKLVDTSSHRENVTGKGYDINGYALFWVRINDKFFLYKYDGNEFSIVASDITVGKFAHFGDIIKINNDELICFWNDYGEQRNYGTAKSIDNGETWTLTTFPQETSNAEVPTETQGVYLGNNKIIAIGRKDIDGGTFAQMQFQSLDNGNTWTKEYTNITDIGASTTSIIYDDSTDEIYAYYYNRTNGQLLMRHAQISVVWDNPTNWPESEIIANGDRGQDAGNVNAVLKNGKHYISYYSGDSKNTGIYDVIKNYREL